ncbi:hypothetical protein ACL9RL_08275 [Plantibacter sp. Mn2098]|uniref:hypothetical protein n=1 Tax=Plantibacter sp. Mn2098 TaxID=3395266 RepID=UPI003BBEBC33
MTNQHPPALQTPSVAPAQAAPTPAAAQTLPSMPTPTPTPTRNPYATLAIVGFVLSFLVPVNVVGLGVSIVVLVKSMRAGYTSKLAVAGIIIASIFIVLMSVFLLFFFVLFMPIYLEGL